MPNPGGMGNLFEWWVEWDFQQAHINFISGVYHRSEIIKAVSCPSMLQRKEIDMMEYTKLLSIGHRRIKMGS